MYASSSEAYCGESSCSVTGRLAAMSPIATSSMPRTLDRAVFLEDLRAPDAVRAVVDDEAMRALAQTIPPPDAPRGESVT